MLQGSHTKPLQPLRQHAGGVSGHDQAGCSEDITQSLRPSGSAWQLTISPNVVARSSLLGKKLQLLSKDWNTRICGDPDVDVDVFDFKKNISDKCLLVGRLVTGVNIPGERQARSMARGKDGDFSMAVD